MVNIKRVIIFTDGAAELNPGLAAIGAIIKDEQGRLVILPLLDPLVEQLITR